MKATYKAVRVDHRTVHIDDERGKAPYDKEYEDVRLEPVSGEAWLTDSPSGSITMTIDNPKEFGKMQQGGEIVVSFAPKA